MTFTSNELTIVSSRCNTALSKPLLVNNTKDFSDTSDFLTNKYFRLSFYRCDHNKYSMDYIISLSHCKRKKKTVQSSDNSEDDNDSDENSNDDLDSEDENFMSILKETVT